MKKRDDIITITFLLFLIVIYYPSLTVLLHPAKSMLKCIERKRGRGQITVRF